MRCLKCFAAFLVLYIVTVPLKIFGQEDKKIQPADAIQIVVHNNEALSQTVVVSPEGTVDFPFMQGLPVEGLALQRFQEILVAQLARYMDRSPLVTVRFTETYPVKVTVLGQIARPGIYLVPNTSTLQGAIGQAGGFIPGAQLSQIKLIRAGETNGANHVVNMEKFYLEGDLKALPALKEGDTIVVPGNPMAISVKVLGSVVRPGSYEVFFRNSLLDVLFMAGGPADDANLSNVKVLSPRGEEAKEVRVNLNGMLRSKDLSAIPVVLPGDVVYVPPRMITWRKIVNVARDLAIFASLYLMVSYGSNTRR